MMMKHLGRKDVSIMSKILYTDSTDDQLDENTSFENEKQKPTKHKRFSHLLSGMVGSIIATTIILFLLFNDLIPINFQEQQVQAQHSHDLPISELITDDDQQIPPTINELSKAIVGIIHLTQKNIWTPSEETGTGSGIIYKVDQDKAYIVTNNHVVEGATEVEVELNHETRVPANVLGTDALTDLAVLEIDSSEVEYVAKLGSSANLQLGETVLAIGNPISMEFSGSVTKGIVSGLDRSLKVDTNGDGYPDWITEVIQTDAAINPGNSGGALVNAEGKVVGINSMKIARQSVEGIGFAIPIDAALPIIEQLEQNGEIARPFIGITTVEINQVPYQYRHNIKLPEDIDKGMVIADVQQDSPADKAGLQQFDVITKINDHEISSLLDLRKYLYSETKIGDTIHMEIVRDGIIKNVQLKLTEQAI